MDIKTSMVAVVASIMIVAVRYLAQRFDLTPATLAEQPMAFSAITILGFVGATWGVLEKPLRVRAKMLILLGVVFGVVVMLGAQTVAVYSGVMMFCVVLCAEWFSEHRLTAVILVAVACTVAPTHIVIGAVVCFAITVSTERLWARFKTRTLPHGMQRV